MIQEAAYFHPGNFVEPVINELIGIPHLSFMAIFRISLLYRALFLKPTPQMHLLMMNFQITTLLMAEWEPVQTQFRKEKCEEFWVPPPLPFVFCSACSSLLTIFLLVYLTEL
jgi:hypothetical protein